MKQAASNSTRIHALDNKRAGAVCRELGIAPSQAIALVYRQVHLSRGIPFPVALPNPVTAQAIADADHGKVNRYDSFEELKSGLSD